VHTDAALDVIGADAARRWAAADGAPGAFAMAVEGAEVALPGAASRAA